MQQSRQAHDKGTMAYLPSFTCIFHIFSIVLRKRRLKREMECPVDLGGWGHSQGLLRPPMRR